jgi:hypothetical protein
MHLYHCRQPRLQFNVYTSKQELELVIPAINYLHIQTMALVFEVISNSPHLWYSGPIQFLNLNIYIQTYIVS